MDKKIANRLNKVSSAGYVVCNINEGRFIHEARFAIADPHDDDEGLYLEDRTLVELLDELDRMLSDGLDLFKVVPKGKNNG